MLAFLAENWGSILIGLLVLGAVVLAIVKMRRNKKNGKSACGCGCSDCPSKNQCHKS